MIYQINSIEELFSDNDSNLELLNEGLIYSHRRKDLSIVVHDESDFGEGYYHNPYFKVFDNKNYKNSDVSVARIFILPINGAPMYTHHKRGPSLWVLDEPDKKLINETCRLVIGKNDDGSNSTVWDKIIQEINKITIPNFHVDYTGTIQPDYRYLKPDVKAQEEIKHPSKRQTRR